MIANSPPLPRLPCPLGTAGPLSDEFLRPFLMPELIEDAIDDLGLFVLEEGVGKVDIFGDDHAGRNVLAHQHLVGAGAKDGAQDRIDAVESPAFGEMAV